jgi:hypothetical protein
MMYEKDGVHSNITSSRNFSETLCSEVHCAFTMPSGFI